MNGLTAADYADTGQWRLIVRIYPDGMTAHLQNTIHADLVPDLLFESNWEADEEALLSHIENAVYDHPRVLDDFSARIIIYDPHTLFIPTDMMEETDGAEEMVYTSIYPADPTDILSDTLKDITALYSPAKGLKGFLNRTFPGAMVESHLMALMRRFEKGDGDRLILNIRPNEADFLLFSGKEFLSGSVHPWKEGEDIVYHAMNIVDVYGLKPSETEVTSIGAKSGEIGTLLAQFVRKFNVES